MIKRLTKITAVAAVITVTALASQAHAGGFLADTFIAPFSPDAARAADQLNAALGNPVDHAGAAACDAIVPGCQPALEGAWAVQRSGVLSQGGGFSASQPQAPAFGNFCQTAAGIIGPGPMNPIGSPCNGMTVYGWMPGRVVR